jgi:hypothetical protein
VDVATLTDLLDEYGFADSDSELKLQAIQGAIWQIEGHKPWPFLETSVDLDFNGSSGTATNLPSDFRAALRVKDLSTGDRITPVRLDDAEDHIGADYSAVGNPAFYYFEGGQMKVWPLPPSSTGRARLKYIRWSTAVTEASAESAILIPKYYHEAILYGALLRLLDSEDDPELSSRYQGHYDLRLLQMETTLFQLQFDRPDVIAITDPDDWDFYH